MIQTQLLQRAIAPDEGVLRDFVAKMAGPFIEQHSLTAAKGSTHHYFGKLPDQSMIAHIFNGLFPTMRLVALADRSQNRPYLSDTGQRLYILGYLMHDLNKIRQLGEEIGTANPVQVQAALAMLSEELEKLNVAAFLPAYKTYLTDILYLVVNTQLKEGANQSVYQMPLYHDERELIRARDLCTYSDCLSFLVQNPAEILNGTAAATFRRVVRDVSDSRFSFAYHQFSDVRGLLTGSINNGVKDWIVNLDGQEEPGAFVPYLYFPNGTVYLKLKRVAQVDLSQDSVWQAVRTKLSQQSASFINENTPGFSFNGKSNLDVPIYFEDLITPASFVELLVKICLRVKANVTRSTYEKLKEMKLPPEVTLDGYNPDDERIAIVGRFLLTFDKKIISRVALLDPEKADDLRNLMRASFGFDESSWADAAKIPSSGGMDYWYFWLAALFIKRQPGLNPAGEEVGSLAHFLTSFTEQARSLYEPAMGLSWRGALLPQLEKYLLAHLSFGGFEGQPVAESLALPDFAAELESYLAAKRSKKAQFPCTICNSPYLIEGRKQTKSDVLFQPWVYKNRLPLYANDNAGGVCAICLLEMMLRQLNQKDELRLTGTDFEEKQFKFLYLYPSYFFTTETAALVRTAVTDFRTFNVGEANKQLAGTRLQAGDFLSLDLFDVSEHDEANPVKQRGYYRMNYDESDQQGLIFFGLRSLNPDLTTTEAWAIPALLGLMIPIALGCKVVVSDNYLPLFTSGENFKETVVLDAPHPFLNYLLTSSLDNIEGVPYFKEDQRAIYPAGRVRIDQLLDQLRTLSRVYFINADTYRESKTGYVKWNMLSRVARGVRSDPLNVFRYLTMQAREKEAGSLLEAYWPQQTRRYMLAYEDIWHNLAKVIGGTDPMEVIKGLVDSYAVFYRPSWRTTSIVRPLEISVKVLFANPRESVQTEAEYASDLKMMIQGELMRWLNRVRSSQGTGWAVFKRKEINEKQAPALKDFADIVYDKVYREYCRGEVGLLRSRLNNLKSGCEAYYALHRQELHPPTSGQSNVDQVAEPVG